MTEEDEYAQRDEYTQRVAAQADRFFQEHAMLEEKWEVLKENARAQEAWHLGFLIWDIARKQGWIEVEEE